MDFLNLAKKRYACKKFSNQEVEQNLLNQILEAGRLAPTAKNLQEQHIYVVRSEDGLKKIDACTPCRYGATTVLIVAYDKNTVYTYPGGKRNSGAEDTTIVATHMILEAANIGIDSCWLNHFDSEKLVSTFGLPENEDIVMLMDLGYALPGTGPLPNHNMRKTLAETVTYLD